MLADWEYIRWEPEILSIEGEHARIRVNFEYRHRASGDHLVGQCRITFEVRDGLIVRADELHDAPMVESFIRFANQKASAKS